MKISNIRLLNEDYEINDNKALHCYTTFQDLIQNASDLKTGDFYKTLGFYNINDGGEGLYEISDTLDGNKMQLQITENLYANLIYNDKISIKAIGAHCNGEDDDSSYIQKAINFGTPLFPNREQIVINNTILCKGSQKVIDFNMCFLNTTNKSLMFRVNDENPTSVVINVLFKNAFVRLGNGGSFIKFNTCYFTELDNIRITGLTDDYLGVQYINGFNHICKNVNIGGKSASAVNVSGNNAIGILLKNAEVESPNVSFNNITNVTIKDCLIQNCEYGIKFENTVNVPTDTTKLQNLGFSNCDYAIYAYTTNANYALDINTLRAEFCGYMVYTNAFMSLGNIYCYHTEHPIYNEGILALYGNIVFFGILGQNVIEYNNNRIDLTGVQSLLRNNYALGDTQNGRIIPSPIRFTQATDIPAFDRFINTVIPITQNFNFDSLNFMEGDGNTVTITGTGTIYNLPDNIPNIVLENNKAVKFVNRNGTLEIY